MVSGKTVGGTQLYAKDNRLTREEALKLFTVGSAWFSGEEQVKRRIAPGQLADFVVLTADYLSVPEEQIKSIESALTVLGRRRRLRCRPVRLTRTARSATRLAGVVAGGAFRRILGDARIRAMTVKRRCPLQRRVRPSHEPRRRAPPRRLRQLPRPTL